MKIIYLVITCFAFFGSCASHADINDCSNPVHPVKKLACKDPSFRELYANLDALYEKESAGSELKELVDADQNNWWNDTSNWCRNSDECFKCSFRTRLAFLSERMRKAEEKRETERKELLKLSHFPADRSIVEGAEIILISGRSFPEVAVKSSFGDQEALSAGPPDSDRIGCKTFTNTEPFSTQKVNIVIDRPNSKVVLVLSTYKEVNWKIQVTPETKIAAIFISGPAPQSVYSNTTTKLYSVDLPFTYEVENANFKGILARLHESLGIDAIDAFKGYYALPQKIEINTVAVPKRELTFDGVKTKNNKTHIDFELINLNMKETRWTLNGPEKTSLNDVPLVESKNLILVRNNIYRVSNDKVEVVDVTSHKSQLLTLPDSFPPVISGNDVAYDSKRNIISLVSSGERGFLYRYSIDEQKWIDYNATEFNGLHSIFYDKIFDRYVSVGGASSIVLISPEGKVISKSNLLEQMPGYDHSDTEIESLNIKMVAKGDDIIFVGIANNIVRKIWHYNLISKAEFLTYQFDVGFDCNKASTKVEKLICLNPIIAKKDASLNNLYKKLLIEHSSDGTIAQNQLSWLKNIRNQCADDSCLSDAYDKRLENLLSLQKGGKPKTIENLLRLSSTAPDKKLAAGAEVIVVSGYEPEGNKMLAAYDKAGGAREASRINVVVNRPKSKIILVLTSYEQVTWQVQASQGTDIVAVITSGNKELAVISDLPSIKYAGFLSDRDQLGYATEIDSINFKRILAGLNKVLGVNKVDIFKGAYKIPSEIVVDSLDAPNEEQTLAGITPKKIQLDFKFDLLTTKHKKVKWSLRGPEAVNSDFKYITKGVVLPSNTYDVYELEAHSAEVSNPFLDTVKMVSLPSNFPQFSWLSDVAYDSKRNIVSVTSDHVGSVLYRFDITNKQWIDFYKFEDESFSTITYDEKLDRYIGWGSFFCRGCLIFISGEGKFLFKINIADGLPGFGQLHNKEDGGLSQLRIIARGNDIALLAISSGIVTNIWYYNLETKIGTLTYKPDIESAP